MTADKIYLVGFMAAGKTTVARALADRLGWRAEDIDELIEQRDRRTIPEIFAQQGETYFRAVELRVNRGRSPTIHARNAKRKNESGLGIFRLAGFDGITSTGDTHHV